MATTDTDRASILNRLDEIFSGPAAHESDDSRDVFGDARTIAASTSDKEYFLLTGSVNATSNSKLGVLHKCPRLYELEGLRAAAKVESETVQANVDFAFGHAVGAGIQTYGATLNLLAAQFAAFISWRAPYDLEKTDKEGKPVGKSLPLALWAVEQFPRFYDRELSEYEVLKLPDGRPAVELSFAIDMQNGFFHFGHIDTVLIHKPTRKLAVWEGKTTGSTVVKDADYANSYQGLGYSVILDAVADALDLPGQDYDVFYITYATQLREFTLMPFHKSRTQRAEWLQDLLITHATIAEYQRLGFYPKRGENCVDRWGRTCQWFGNCQMRNDSLFPNAAQRRIQSVQELKSVDFFFTLNQLVESQRNKA